MPRFDTMVEAGGVAPLYSGSSGWIGVNYRNPHRTARRYIWHAECIVPDVPSVSALQAGWIDRFTISRRSTRTRYVP
jgi:hypothetical protein